MSGNITASPSAGGGGGGGGGGSSGSGGTGSSSTGPCGACKFLRRKCVMGCIFAPYFDSEQGAANFAAVHKVFGASNVSKLLLHIPAHKRLDAVVTVCYEAQARLRDPVYGCVAHIFSLQQQVVNLQAELSYLQAQLATLELPSPPPVPPPPSPTAAFSMSDLASVSTTSILSYSTLSTVLLDPRLQPPWSLQHQPRPTELGQQCSAGTRILTEISGCSSGDLLDRHRTTTSEPPPALCQSKITP